MARLPPNKPSSRRDQDKRASSSNRKTRPQITDAAAGNSSREASFNENPLDASSPVIDETSDLPDDSQLFETPRSTAAENLRRSSFLSLLSSRNNADEVTGDGQQTDIQTRLNEFFKRQEAFNRRMEEQVKFAMNQETAEKTSKSKRLPKELSSNVRAVYEKSDKKWDLTKKFNDQERETNTAILAGVRSTDSKTSTALIMRAMRVHFKTKKRQQQNKELKKDAQVLKEQRKRSRLNSKKANRVKALNQSTSIAEEDKRKYSAVMTLDFMSSEESASEDEMNDHLNDDSDSEEEECNKRKKKDFFLVKSLPWRSEEVTRLMKVLDKKSKRRKSQKSVNMSLERRVGPPSKRLAPIDAPDFSIN